MDKISVNNLFDGGDQQGPTACPMRLNPSKHCLPRHAVVIIVCGRGFKFESN